MNKITSIQTLYDDGRVVLRYAILDDAGNRVSRSDAVMDMPFADGVTQAQAQAYLDGHVQAIAPQIDPVKQPDAVTDALLALGQASAALEAKRAQIADLDQQLADKQAALADTVPAAAPTTPLGVQ